MRKKLVRGGLVGLSVFLVCLFLRELGVFDPLEWKSWDLRLRLLADRGRADPNIVLIAIDQYSLDIYEKEQGLPWPWPRQLYVAVIDFLRAGGAKAVVFDLILSETSRFGVEDDELLAKAMKRAGNVFLPFFLSVEESESPDEGTALLKRFALQGGVTGRHGPTVLNSAALPVEVLARACRGMGNVQFAPDRDSVYRRLPLFFDFRGLALPALPLILARFLSPDLDVGAVPLDASGRMIIRYHGPAGTYKTYSAAAIINSQARIEEGQAPQIPPSEFAGKTVFVGTTAPGLYDFRPSPFGGIFHGMEILATATDNLVRRDHIRTASRSVVWIMIACFSLLAGLGTSVLKKTWQISIFFFFSLALPAAASVAAFSSGVWLDLAAPLFSVLVAFIGAALLNYSVEGRRRRFLKSVFRHYLSPDVIDRVLRNPALLRLGGERREITAFFSDVAGFTTISEGLQPEDLVALLNAYLSEMTDIILETGGTLDKYEGDAIIAFWNAPLDQPDHALRACRAALRCQKRLDELRPDFTARYGGEIRMRIGLNSGPAVVGNMGSERRFDYTAMGDTMNLASRLEGVSKAYGVRALIGEETQRRAGADVVTREIDLIRVVGKSQPVRVFELIGEKEELSAERLEGIGRFHLALKYYREREWERALEIFQGLGDDGPARLYVERCRAFLADPAPENWDGVFEHKVK